MSETSSEQKRDYLSTRTKIRTSDLMLAKQRGEKWAMLTSYDATSARIFDLAGIPCILIGDSAAQAVYGYKSTLPVTMDELISLARAVASSCKRALVIVDMPFGSYQESPEQALRNATRFMKEAQVHGVKLEGGADYHKHVALLTRSGIPVMAHVGFTPQSEHSLGGYKVQGRNDGANKILNDVITLEDHGAFACVLELVPSHVAESVTKQVKIPVVGIGAGPNCDAQILVWTDMVGFSAPKDSSSIGPTSYLGDNGESTPHDSGKQRSDKNEKTLELSRAPKFVKRYANVSDIIYKAVLEYANDVKNGTYPAPEHCYQ